MSGHRNPEPRPTRSVRSGEPRRRRAGAGRRFLPAGPGRSRCAAGSWTRTAVHRAVVRGPAPRSDRNPPEPTAAPIPCSPFPGPAFSARGGFPTDRNPSGQISRGGPTSGRGLASVPARRSDPVRPGPLRTAPARIGSGGSAGRKAGRGPNAKPRQAHGLSACDILHNQNRVYSSHSMFCHIVTPVQIAVNCFPGMDSARGIDGVLI